MKASADFEDDNVPAYILDIREKLKDKGYIDCAIQRIALVLSKRLMDTGDVDRLFAV